MGGSHVLQMDFVVVMVSLMTEAHNIGLKPTSSGEDGVGGVLLGNVL